MYKRQTHISQLLLHHFNNDRGSHAAARAQGRETVFFTTFLEFVQQGDYQSGACRADRMSQGNATAVDIQLVLLNAKGLLAGDALRRERFVDLKQIDIVNGQTRLFERLLGCLLYTSRCV